jgi:hypothetical protein
MDIRNVKQFHGSSDSSGEYAVAPIKAPRKRRLQPLPLRIKAPAFSACIRNPVQSFQVPEPATTPLGTHTLSEYTAMLPKGKIEAKSVDADEGSCDPNVQLIASNAK